jgi:hypothetical protein
MNLLHAAPPEYVGIYLSKALPFASISMKTIRDPTSRREVMFMNASFFASNRNTRNAGF